MSCFNSIRKWVLKRPFWFFKKINVIFSSNWTILYRGGCSQNFISSKKFDSSICERKNELSIFEKYYLFCIDSFRVDGDASIVSNSSMSATSTSPFQIPSAYNAYGLSQFLGDTQPLTQKGKIVPFNGCPKHLSYGVFPSDKRSVTFRRQV